MLCFEVTVNGKPYCVAGTDGRFFAAGVAGPVQLPGGRIGPMKVSAHGASTDATESYSWDGGECFLEVGDVVNVAVVERDTADAPASSPTGFRVTEDGELVRHPVAPTAPGGLFESGSRELRGLTFLQMLACIGLMATWTLYFW